MLKHNYLSLSTHFKNDAPYLKEWIEFHLMVGVEKFYLWNNESTDDYMSILQPYINKKIVHLENQPCHMEGLNEGNSINKTLKLFGHNTRWLILHLNIDEFLYLRNGTDLKPFLKEYEKFGGLGVNWICFSSSGINKKPESQLEYTKCWKDSSSPQRSDMAWHIKSIVQPRFVKDALNRTPIHCVNYKNGYYCVNSENEKIDGPAHKPNHSKIRINHYFTRSKEEFEQKIDRQKGFLKPEVKLRKLWEKYHNTCIEKDSHILTLKKELERRMK